MTDKLNNFQKFAIDNYVKNYYKTKKTKFLRICRPKKIYKGFKGIPTTNFDAEYYNSDFDEIWKINFLIANNCVIKIMKKYKIKLPKNIKENSK